MHEICIKSVSSNSSNLVGHLRNHRLQEAQLVTSNFSFSHSVFKRPVMLTHKNQGLFGKGLTSQNFNPFQNKPWFFTCLQFQSVENTAGKGEIANKQQFLLFPRCFLTHLIILINSEIVVCNLFQFGKVQNLLFGTELRKYL